jgi:hypothetical protein
MLLKHTSCLSYSASHAWSSPPNRPYCGRKGTVGGQDCNSGEVIENSGLCIRPWGRCVPAGAHTQYVPTIGFNNEVFLHNDILLGAHASQRTKRNGGLQPTGTPGARLFVASSLPQAVLDKALGPPEELAELLGS